ncbi:LysR family transcriptional regulator [Ferrimonas sediminicola]|uniref:LysR family transcriptional regulator n=1 Tax=Ferrimonas sediminicola TaxID=2569538 RepID=A0A4U1BF88_9GAMM|nr:LysR family transcriptional regulator [Ferrimonas sediminicola]TKB49771.1 LysR family transcriptional regulator [Ferrimonas sediminicola]
MPVLMRDFDSIDIRLLIVFRAVVFTGSLSKAARKLSVTPSAVSQSLSKLSKYFSHPLFTRTSNGLEPTDFAMELYGYVNSALDLLQDGVESLSDFDAANSKRRFRIAANHILDLIVLHPLTRRVESFNGQLKISVNNLVEEESKIIDSLQIDNNDLCLVALKVDMKSIVQEKLLEEEMVVLGCRNNPLTKEVIDMDTYLAQRHVRYAVGQIGYKMGNALNLGYVDEREVFLDTNNPFNAMVMAQETDALVTVSRWLWEKYGHQFELAEVKTSFEIPKVPLYLTYLKKMEDSKANRWLRDQVKETLSKIR